MAEDKKNGSVIPLEAILTGRGGPGMDNAFNLYYVHWWSLTHYLLHGESGTRRKVLAERLAGTERVSFQGPALEELEQGWYAYTLGLKRNVAGRSTPAPILRLAPKPPAPVP